MPPKDVVISGASKVQAVEARTPTCQGSVGEQEATRDAWQNNKACENLIGDLLATQTIYSLLNKDSTSPDKS